MTWIGKIGVLVALGMVCGVPDSWSQDTRDEALKRSVERNFEVLPLRDGLALRPKSPLGGVRSIEISGGTIAIDGQPATGSELRARLGTGADAVLQLSYLTDAERRTLFVAPSDAQPPAPSTPYAPAPPSPQIAPPDQPREPDSPVRTRRPRTGRRSNDRVRVGGAVTVERGEIVDGDVVAVGGRVDVFGEVHGDVVAVGGGVALGPEAVVDGDVTAVGGPLRRDPSAQVRGKAQEVSLGGLDFSQWSWRRNPVGTWWSSMLGSAFALVGTLVRVAVLCLFAVLVVLFGRDYAERAGAVATDDSLKAGAIGFLSQLLFVPLLVITIITLVMTIIGIPLLLTLPFVVLGLAVAGLVGFTGVATRVGEFVLHRFGRQETNPYTVTVVGVLALMTPVILSRLASLGGGLMFPFALGLGIVGAVIEYVAWTVGFGAVALARFRRRGDSRAAMTNPAV